MSATVVREKRQTTIPQDVSKAAGLKPGDQVDWRFEDGEIRGRKLVNQRGKRVFAKLARRGDLLIGELPKGLKLDRDAISRAIHADREGR